MEKNKPLLFIKYGKKENLEMLQSGFLYFKESKYYRKLEVKKGMGDEMDSAIIHRHSKIEIDGTVIPAPDIMIETNNKDDKTPIFCLTILTTDDFIQISDNASCYNIKDDNIERYKSDFGEYALLIYNPHLFIHRIKDYCEKNDIDIRHRPITYVDYNCDDTYWYSFYQNDLSHFFIKDTYFSYQKEFRLLVANKFVEENRNFYTIQLNTDFNDCSMIVPVESLTKLTYDNNK